MGEGRGGVGEGRGGEVWERTGRGGVGEGRGEEEWQRRNGRGEGRGGMGEGRAGAHPKRKHLLSPTKLTGAVPREQSEILRKVYGTGK